MDTKKPKRKINKANYFIFTKRDSIKKHQQSEIQSLYKYTNIDIEELEKRDTQILMDKIETVKVEQTIIERILQVSHQFSIVPISNKKIPFNNVISLQKIISLIGKEKIEIVNYTSFQILTTMESKRKNSNQRPKRKVTNKLPSYERLVEFLQSYLINFNSQNTVSIPSDSIKRIFDMLNMEIYYVLSFCIINCIQYDGEEEESLENIERNNLMNFRTMFIQKISEYEDSEKVCQFQFKNDMPKAIITGNFEDFFAPLVNVEIKENTPVDHHKNPAFAVESGETEEENILEKSKFFDDVDSPINLVDQNVIVNNVEEKNHEDEMDIKDEEEEVQDSNGNIFKVMKYILCESNKKNDEISEWYEFVDRNGIRVKVKRIKEDENVIPNESKFEEIKDEIIEVQNNTQKPTIKNENVVIEIAQDQIISNADIIHLNQQIESINEQIQEVVDNFQEQQKEKFEEVVNNVEGTHLELHKEIFNKQIDDVLKIVEETYKDEQINEIIKIDNVEETDIDEQNDNNGNIEELVNDNEEQINVHIEEGINIVEENGINSQKEQLDEVVYNVEKTDKMDTCIQNKSETAFEINEAMHLTNSDNLEIQTEKANEQIEETVCNVEETPSEIHTKQIYEHIEEAINYVEEQKDDIDVAVNNFEEIHTGDKTEKIKEHKYEVIYNDEESHKNKQSEYAESYFTKENDLANQIQTDKEIIINVVSEIEERNEQMKNIEDLKRENLSIEHEENKKSKEDSIPIEINIKPNFPGIQSETDREVTIQIITEANQELSNNYKSIDVLAEIQQTPCEIVCRNFLEENDDTRVKPLTKSSSLSEVKLDVKNSSSEIERLEIKTEIINVDLDEKTVNISEIIFTNEDITEIPVEHNLSCEKSLHSVDIITTKDNLIDSEAKISFEENKIEKEDPIAKEITIENEIILNEKIEVQEIPFEPVEKLSDRREDILLTEENKLQQINLLYTPLTNTYTIQVKLTENRFSLLKGSLSEENKDSNCEKISYFDKINILHQEGEIITYSDENPSSDTNSAQKTKPNNKERNSENQIYSNNKTTPMQMKVNEPLQIHKKLFKCLRFPIEMLMKSLIEKIEDVNEKEEKSSLLNKRDNLTLCSEDFEKFYSANITNTEVYHRFSNEEINFRISEDLLTTYYGITNVRDLILLEQNFTQCESIIGDSVDVSNVQVEVPLNNSINKNYLLPETAENTLKMSYPLNSFLFLGHISNINRHLVHRKKIENKLKRKLSYKEFLFMKDKFSFP